MTFGIKRTKRHNKEIGYLHFKNGRTIRLNDKELKEFNQKVRFWQAVGFLKAEEKIKGKS